MPIEISFDADKGLIRYDLSDPLTMEELLEAYGEEKQFRDSSELTVHSIVDMTNVKRIPPNWLTAKAGPGLTHPRSGVIMFVGLSFGLKIIVTTIMRITGYQRMQAFDSVEEALAYFETLQDEEAPSA